jgi:2-polyprenyl-3-methyl-5-hydroxy-6-metoxy-1,4-benzoquinol methylase
VILCPDCRGDLGGLDAERCAACGWTVSRIDGVPVLLSSRDRESELFTRYLANYDRIASDDLACGIQEMRTQQFFNERLLGYLGNMSGLRVCDVGIGKGILFEMLGRSGPASLVGVDISMPYLERFVNDADSTVVLANAENLPFRDAFDLVVAADVLEHVLNVGDVLMSVRESLVANGTFVVRVPYLDNMLQYARLNGCQYDMVHLRNFASRNLEHLLRHTGFVVERLCYDGFNKWRARPYVARTQLGMWLLEAFSERLLGGEERLERLNPRVGRVLMDPLVVTAITRRA